MTTITMRQKLHQFIDSIEEKKAKAIYTLFEEEIEQSKRISIKQYNKEIDESMKRVSAGKYTTQKELEKEMQSW